MGLFNNYNEIEENLLKMYSQMFADMEMPDAKKTAKDMLDRVIRESKEVGTYVLPMNFGNIILKEEKAEDLGIERAAEKIREGLFQKRNEGVKDEDIKWWWNLNDIERAMMLSIDELHRMVLFMSELKNGKTDKDAAKIVWKFHPRYTYGDPSIKPQKAPFELKREDFLLPVELKDRVNVYIEKRAKGNPEKYKKYIESFSTFNSLVRKEIKSGNI